MAEGSVARSRRSTELGLVLLSGIITASAYVLASLGKHSTMPARVVPFMLFVLGLLACGHFVVRFTAKGADPMFLPMAAFVHGLGFVMIARLNDRWAGLQATWSLIGLLAFTATLIFIERTGDLRRYQFTSLGLGLVLLLLPMIPGIGFTSGGARIWVSVGPINFQPGEFAKILLAVFFAAYLAERRDLIVDGHIRFLGVTLPELRHLAPILVAWAVSVVVMVGEKDLGSSLLFFTLFVVMLWVATERVSFLFMGGGMFAIGAVIAYKLFSHVRTRVDIWLNPWAQETGRGYQPIQALYGMAHGGLTGTGLGMGSPDLIPAAHNDFIFAALGEEIGLIGVTAVLAAYALLVGAGMRTALRAQRDFEKLLAVGLTTITAVQTFIIVGGVLRVVPLTGVTLPFMSYGGSSLVANYMLLAILIRISDTTARQLHEVPNSASMSERFATWKLQRASRSHDGNSSQGVAS
jgi:cell division protein FtsW (lipid II flippase)